MIDCISCSVKKDVSEFYKHPSTKSGQLTKCKECCKDYAKKALKEKMKDPEFAEKERLRHLEKDRRLYRKTWKPLRKMLPRKHDSTWRNHFEKYPEKAKARAAAQYQRSAKKGNHLHHWSYKAKNSLSLFDLSPKDHRKVHKELLYIQKYKCYETRDGVLLDSKTKHIDFLISLGIKVLKHTHHKGYII